MLGEGSQLRFLPFQLSLAELWKSLLSSNNSPVSQQSCRLTQHPWHLPFIPMELASASATHAGVCQCPGVKKVQSAGPAQTKSRQKFFTLKEEQKAFKKVGGWDLAWKLHGTSMKCPRTSTEHKYRGRAPPPAPTSRPCPPAPLPSRTGLGFF